MNDLPAAPARFWSAVLVAGAVALAVAGGAIDNFRPEPSGRVPKDTRLPTAEEPQGQLPEPPRTFRWTPGGDDVDVAQVLLFRANLEPFWQSAPVPGPPLEIVPEEAFAEVPAGEKLFWRVREVQGGRPRATSALVEFSYEVDTAGRGPRGAAPEAPLPRD